MRQILPTLAYELAENANPSDESEDLCGAEMSNGDVCDRLSSECPYESHGDA